MQKEVAEKSGLSVFTISSFENGSSTGITMSSFIKLLRAIDSLRKSNFYRNCLRALEPLFKNKVK